jgi:transcriptional regulator with XRE-family HTH domain
VTKKRTKLSDQIRREVDRSGLSRYRVCRLAGIDEGSFSRFMARKVGLSLPTLDALAEALNLDVVAGTEDEEITLAPIELPKRCKHQGKDGDA